MGRLTHPRPPHIYPAPSGWRATCRACGWEHGPYHDRHDAIGGFLDHAELEHGVIVRDHTINPEDAA